MPFRKIWMGLFFPTILKKGVCFPNILQTIPLAPPPAAPSGRGGDIFSKYLEIRYFFKICGKMPIHIFLNDTIGQYSDTIQTLLDTTRSRISLKKVPIVENLTQKGTLCTTHLLESAACILYKLPWGAQLHVDAVCLHSHSLFYMVTCVPL